ncbi:hypothetical protein Enr10x_24100 [Gimesia panareensis]|uniref:Uncharacterized protein n=1 Tax=Gimesia panareensis TaxID=2527978 RepID=A0A517Q682_9PLAN|nr:hypothetical protein Enr10x_24100 [Gimesia panareensis]QDU50057.1 hypothetical protein Pan110_23990 [Gimesia panareensis]
MREYNFLLISPCRRQSIPYWNIPDTLVFIFGEASICYHFTERTGLQSFT